jgi:hypothetical protein
VNALLVIWCIGVPFTSGLIGGIGNYCKFKFWPVNWFADIALCLVWPLFYVVWAFWKTGEWLRNDED